MKRVASRSMPVLAVLVLFWLFPNIGKTIDDLRRTSVRTVRIFLSGNSEYFQPRSGEDELEPEALGAIHLLRENGLEEYEASLKLRRIHWYQRVVEGAWPIRIVESSGARVLLKGENIPNNCKRRGASHDVVLVFCR